MTDSTEPALGTQELALRRAGDALSAAQDEFVRAANEALHAATHRLERASYPGLHLQQLRDAMCNHADASSCEWVPTPIRLLGSGPWEQKEFAEFLVSKGFDLAQDDEEVGALVLGAHDFDVEVLADVLASIRDETPIYTQELFVLGLVREENPYGVLEQDPINQIAEAHPGIAFLLEAGTAWPIWPEVTEEAEVAGDVAEESPIAAPLNEFDLDLAESSPLHKLGYNARADGPHEQKRHSILGQAFSSSKLPGLKPEEEDRWGAAGSAARLKAMSSFLAWLIRFRGSEASEARQKWVADLAWLRSKYYRPEMEFDWPRLQSRAASKRTPNAAFMKPLSPDRLLAAVIGPGPLPRTEIVSKLWAYIKKNSLQDQENKRMVNADQKLAALFGRNQVSMFEMAGLIGKHVR